ncbi:UPF0016 family protein [Brevibacillus antibioticus]|uniref:UPF0016 family protein n=1 Tax=Brevibacillus antibioticus TaxID=2570228 RepID=A0A4V5TIK0_9BACL|nr:UPF0016 family protein [Brevibacillus antibioticus]TKI55453.1 UPF0016 family protein [Brevibacillus antibioticus]
MKKRIRYRKRYAFLGAVAGYFIALLASPILPTFIMLAIPLLTVAIGVVFAEKKEQQFSGLTVPEPVQRIPSNEAESEQTKREPESIYSSEIREYLQIIKEIVINENEKRNLDDEISEKTTSLCSKIDTLLPYIETLGSAQTKHDIKMIVMKDLNSVINPFLRLSVENKLKNRRKLLDGLRDINLKLKVISTSIEQHDIYELERKLDLITEKYNAKEIY